ncbi:MAG: helix-turn-helix transcriptional regulator [Chloroflexota bacterium]|jgi:DNA-binding CsgD family transcriptional regulator
MFKQIWQTFRRGSDSQPALVVDADLLALLEQLAAEERRAVDEVAGELLWNAVAERYTAVENFQPWDELTPREKETAALACLGYTNREMAALMVISTNTVKTHMRHVLRKFRVSNKSELREVLAGWDFAGWLKERDLLPSTNPGAPDEASSR